LAHYYPGRFPTVRAKKQVTGGRHFFAGTGVTGCVNIKKDRNAGSSVFYNHTWIVRNL